MMKDDTTYEMIYDMIYDMIFDIQSLAFEPAVGRRKS